MPALLADDRQAENSAIFYSDSSSPKVCTYEGDLEAPQPPPCGANNTAPAKSLDEGAAVGAFLTIQAAANGPSGSSESSGSIQPATSAPLEVSPDDLSSSDTPSRGLNMGAVVGGAAAAVAVLLLLCGVGLCALGPRFKARRSKRTETNSKYRVSCIPFARTVTQSSCVYLEHLALPFVLLST